MASSASSKGCVNPKFPVEDLPVADVDDVGYVGYVGYADYADYAGDEYRHDPYSELTVDDLIELDVDLVFVP